MSFLSILLFISAFYFAHGRPDAAVTAAAVGQTEAVSSSESSTDDSISSEQYGQYDDELNGFIQALSLAFDKYMLTMMPNITEDKQDLVTTMIKNSFGGFFNYIILMYINEGTNCTNDGQNLPLYETDITLEFDVMEPLDEDSVFIPAITASDIENTAEAQDVSELDVTPDSETNPKSNT